MIQWEVVRHQVAITGRVTDVQTRQAIGGALVSIMDAPAAFTNRLALRAQQYGPAWVSMLERPDRTTTAPDGHFHFLDLPDGQYTLMASLPGSGSRYGTVQATATIARDAQGKLTLAAAPMALPPTALKGQINGPDGNPVAIAAVQVKGSGESTFTDGQGQYLLAGLEIGTRAVLVSARGFQPATQTVALSQAGAVQTLNVTLARSTS